MLLKLYQMLLEIPIACRANALHELYRNIPTIFHCRFIYEMHFYSSFKFDLMLISMFRWIDDTTYM